VNYFLDRINGQDYITGWYEASGWASVVKAWRKGWSDCANRVGVIVNETNNLPLQFLEYAGIPALARAKVNEWRPKARFFHFRVMMKASYSGPGAAFDTVICPGWVQPFSALRTEPSAWIRGSRIAFILP
jgi:hypothetical protein